MEASRRVIIIVAGPDNAKKRIASYRSNLMNLTETIYAHVRALPADLQRETLDFITYLEMRYKVTAKPDSRLTGDAFIARFAGCLGDDFPDDVDDADLAGDVPRDEIE